MKEIERKFLIKTMPYLNKHTVVSYKRYFLYRDDKVELRIQQRDDKYELERKEIENVLSADKTKLEISKEEFEKLSALCEESISRKSYRKEDEPNITIKTYEDKFQGFSRIEVEFDSIRESQNFEIPSWFGEEITDTPLAKDSKLINLSSEEFQELLGR